MARCGLNPGNSAPSLRRFAAQIIYPSAGLARFDSHWVRRVARLIRTG